MVLTLTHLLLLLILLLGIFALVLVFFGAKIREKMSATSMYNLATCLVVASIISGTISFLAVWVALSSNQKVCYNQHDVIADIFGVLVTVLMGWNILSVVDIKREAGKVGVVSNDLELIIKSVLQLSIHSFTMREKKAYIIDSCIKSLEVINLCDDKKLRDSAIQEILDVLQFVADEREEGVQIKVFRDKKHYISVLRNCKDFDTTEIQDMIQYAEATDKDDQQYEFSNKDLSSADATFK